MTRKLVEWDERASAAKWLGVEAYIEKSRPLLKWLENPQVPMVVVVVGHTTVTPY